MRSSCFGKHAVTLCHSPLDPICLRGCDVQSVFLGGLRNKFQVLALILRFVEGQEGGMPITQLSTFIPSLHFYPFIA